MRGLPRRFFLERIVDESGVSGTGRVAHGVIFADGAVAMRWDTDVASTAIYNSIEDVVYIHGHQGATHVVMVDEEIEMVPLPRAVNQ